jgi:hypothetical protein
MEQSMRQPSRIAALGLAVLFVAGATLTVAAQPSSTRHGGRPRVEVNPGRLLYRRCEVQYVVQYRPSGTVLFPAKHCWWVRG